MADAFQPKFVDLVRNITTTTGTGNFTLGTAVNGYTSFTAALQPGDSFYYSALGVDKPGEREVGRGTLQANGTITRTPISGAKTNFTSGTKTISLIAAAEWFSTIQAGGGGGASVTVPVLAADRAELAGATNRQVPALLMEAGREGRFQFDASDLSARVSADAGRGVHVPPASDPSGASGAWVRKYDGPVNVKWFGAKGDADASGSTGTDDSAAIQAAIACISALGGGTLYFPPGNYKASGSLNLDGLHNIVLRGASGHGTGYGSPPPSQLIFTGGGSGRFISAQNSNAISVRELGVRYSSAAFTGDLIAFTNTNAGQDAAYALVERSLIAGINVATARSLISLEGAILCSVVDNHIAWGVVGVRGRKEVAVGNVLYSNAHVVERNTFDNLTTSALLNAGEGWTVSGNWFEGTNGGSGGMPRAYYDDISAASGAITSGLSWIGNWHGDAVAVTDAWFRNGFTGMRGLTVCGGLFDTAGASVPGIKLSATCEGVSISGASFSGTVDLSNATHMGVSINGNYLGADVANIHASNVVDLSIAGNRKNGGYAKSWMRHNVVEDYLLKTDSMSVEAPPATNLEVELRSDAGQSRFMRFMAGGTTRALFGTDTAAGGENFVLVTYDNLGGFVGYAMSISRTTMAATFGGAITAANLSGTNSGDETSASILAKLSAQNIATSGTITSSAGKVGYSTGAGGAVTQATSKSTGVTINKATGQITMNAAALAAAAVVEFTVTNNTVVATDTINLNLASGAAASTAYRYWVSAIGAGSFKVVVENRSGASLSEALVMNFAVLKAVNA